MAKSQTARSIVDSALNLPSQKRNAFVEDACEGDTHLKQDVLVLLSQSDNQIPTDAAENAKSMIGEQVGPYKIEGIIGAGGMGMIHKAKDSRLDRYVALKCLPPHLTVNNQNRERFLNEAKAVSRLDHANICTLYDIGETDDKQLYIAMPFYDGYTLDKRMCNGPMPLDDTIAICLQISEGLHAAHNSGIVHRDIKPANVIVTSENVVKVLDFGVAKISGVNLTSTGVSLGTVAYMSPEQLCSEKIDARTDIWALGIMFYEMLVGERPYKGDQAPAIIHSVLYADRPNLSLPDHLPKALNLIIDKALARAVEDRYPSLIEFMADLRKISNNETIAPHSPKNDDRAFDPNAPTKETIVYFEQRTIDDLTKELTKHVGPMAPVLISKAIKISTSMEELCLKLDEHLPSDGVRQQIRQRFATSTSSSNMTAEQPTATRLTLTETQLQCVSSVTTSFIGPIGKLLVNRYSKKSQSADELCQLLAEHVDDVADRTKLVSKIKECF
ncbi:Serine/threonine protein kinase [hydrothermal vent metagenome]|uniref:Serine/threonine protein kinase n=1 Tax=hydrothermal vent metagenome TaxID=652676 RepID=A0A3B0ZJK9_9ZZZZ